ncbi:MAG: AmmeMemoRadiSam system radical SAM enzyme [Fibrobacterota bacterium]
MEQARFWQMAGRGRVRCGLCAHGCVIPEGRTGRCAVRRNRDGVLYSENYGEMAALALDPVEKKPLLHFLPGSTTYSYAARGCNFHCAFCQNASLSQANGFTIPSRQIGPEALVAQAVRSGARSISFTYSEPTVFFEFAEDTARLARLQGLRNVFVTNGFMSPAACQAAASFLDAVNVDLKCFSEATYRKVMGGALGPVLENIRVLHAAGVWLEVTTLLVPSMNDSEAEFRAIARFLASVSVDLPWHLSRFHPQYRMTDRDPTPVALLRRACDIGREEGLRFVYTGNVPGEEGESTRCPDCRTRLIQRHGCSVSSSNLLPDGRCPHCGLAMPGVFD